MNIFNIYNFGIFSKDDFAISNNNFSYGIYEHDYDYIEKTNNENCYFVSEDHNHDLTSSHFYDDEQDRYGYGIVFEEKMIIVNAFNNHINHNGDADCIQNALEHNNNL